MLEQFLSGIKNEALSGITNNVDIPNSKLDDILKIAGKVTKKEVSKETKKSGVENIMNLFSNTQNNSAANSIEGNIMNGVVANIIKKTGLSHSAATSAASVVVPLVLKQITSKNSETPENDASPLNEIFGLLNKGSKSGILGKLSGLFGK